MAKVHVQFRPNWEDGRGVFLGSFLHDLLSRARQWLDLIYGGELHAKAMILARQSSEANITMGYHDETGKLHITQLPMDTQSKVGAVGASTM